MPWIPITKLDSRHCSFLHAAFGYGCTEELGQAISYCYSVTSAHLLNLLRTKFNFVGHLAALKRYLLLGQGDFIHQLMLDIQYVECGWGGAGSGSKS